jgi:hypothetical protein
MQLISQHLSISLNLLRLFFRGRELKKLRTLNDCDILNNSTLYLVVNSSSQTDTISLYGNLPCPDSLNQLIGQARRSITAGLIPKLALEGLGSAYFIRNTQKQNLAVFKPEDEEPFTPNNRRFACLSCPFERWAVI